MDERYVNATGRITEGQISIVIRMTMTLIGIRIEETHCLDRLSIILTAHPNLKVIRSCQKTWEKELSFQTMDA